MIINPNILKKLSKESQEKIIELESRLNYLKEEGLKMDKEIELLEDLEW